MNLWLWLPLFWISSGRRLLPKEVNAEGEEEDPRAELVQKLLQYKMYKYMSYELRDKMDDASGVYYRKEDVPEEVLQYREPVDPSELLAGLTLEKLNAIYQSIIRRQDDRRDPIEVSSERSRRRK